MHHDDAAPQLCYLTDVIAVCLIPHFYLYTQPGDDDYEVIEGSKFAVSRTAFRDNSSYYRINDRKSTYKEVAVLLRGSGIDLDHNRFLILQVRHPSIIHEMS